MGDIWITNTFKLTMFFKHQIKNFQGKPGYSTATETPQQKHPLNWDATTFEVDYTQTIS